MKLFQIIITLILGVFAINTEFRSIKQYSLFFDWVHSAPFYILWLLMFFFLVVNIIQYIKYRKILVLLPLLICIISILIVVRIKTRRDFLDNSETSFKATTYSIGNDGGFILDFKKNGHLKAERRDHWLLTYYWGKFTSKGDTIYLDIPLDFNLGKQAVLNGKTLNIINDTVTFETYQN